MSKAKSKPERNQFDFRIFILGLIVNPDNKLNFISLEQRGNHVFYLNAQRKILLRRKADIKLYESVENLKNEVFQ